MSNKALLLHIGILCLAAAPLGCVSIAGGVVGGGLLAAGEHVLKDSAKATIAVPLAETRRITRNVLNGLDVKILDETPTRSDGRVARWDFEAALVGDDILAVDVILVRMTEAITQVRVYTRKGPLSPDPTTASMIADRIAVAATAAAHRSTAARN